MKRITKNELVKLCQSKGIRVEKITNQYAYLNDDTTGSLPNVHPELTPLSILKSWSHKEWNNGVEVDRSMKYFIKNNGMLGAIKCIRSNTGLGLKESRGIVCDNWNEWRKIIENNP